MLRTPNWSAPRSEWSADRMSTQGTCEPRFERVREEFERNFAERGEVGASVCVTLDGQTVVDLWGGTARPDQPWAQDTIGNVWSATKCAVALCAHLLAARGQPGMYRPLALGGALLVAASQVAVMGAVCSANSVVALLLVPTRWALGF